MSGFSLSRYMTLSTCKVAMVFLSITIACWSALQLQLDRTVFLCVLSVLSLVTFFFACYMVVRWRDQSLDDLFWLCLLLLWWSNFFKLGVSLYNLYIYLGLGGAILISLGLAFLQRLEQHPEPEPMVVWADPLMLKKGNPALDGYLWSQDYGCLLDLLDDQRIAIISVGDDSGVDNMLYLRKVRNGDQEEYRAWNRHECLTVWSSDRHDGRVFSDCCAELRIRFLL